jgi:hypothetical protein
MAVHARQLADHVANHVQCKAGLVVREVDFGCQIVQDNDGQITLRIKGCEA